MTTRKTWAHSLGRQMSELLRQAYIQQYTSTSFAVASIMPFEVMDPEGALAERTVWRRGIRMDLPTTARG